MREFVYFSSKARTSGNFDSSKLMEAGRMDIVCHFVINSLFISHHIRQDTKLHLVFYGPPNPPMHLEMFPGKVIPETGVDAGKEQLDISKRDIAGLIKKMLYKQREGKKMEVWPGYFIEKKSLFKVMRELQDEGKTIYILDAKGENIRNVEISKDCVFLLGDHEGIPLKELKRLKNIFIPISLGKTVYFASQVATIVNHEIDMSEK